MHPTLVVRGTSNTASAALTSHSSLAEGVRGCFHSHASHISFYNLLRCGAHARAQDRLLNPLPLCHEKGVMPVMKTILMPYSEDLMLLIALKE